MVKNLLIFFIFSYTISSSSQVDMAKVETINSILCDCLNSNELKDDNTRIDECTSVLLDGLSVIKDETIREIYAQKSDTYLQRKCLKYVSIIFNNVPESNIELVDEIVFDNLKNISIREIIGNYSYKDYLGETFDVEITQSSWNEKMLSSNNFIKFHFNKANKHLIFKESNDIFFKDFYKKEEKIEIRYKFNKSENLEVVFDLGNNIYIKKTLLKKSN